VVENKVADYNKQIEGLGDSEDDVAKKNRIQGKIEKLNEILNYNLGDMSLADIYNADDASFVKERSKIGF
jgi:hypothetical protein